MYSASAQIYAVEAICAEAIAIGRLMDSIKEARMPVLTDEEFRKLDCEQCGKGYHRHTHGWVNKGPGKHYPDWSWVCGDCRNHLERDQP